MMRYVAVLCCLFVMSLPVKPAAADANKYKLFRGLNGIGLTLDINNNKESCYFEPDDIFKLFDITFARTFFQTQLKYRRRQYGDNSAKPENNISISIQINDTDTVGGCVYQFQYQISIYGNFRNEANFEEYTILTILKDSILFTGDRQWVVQNFLDEGKEIAFRLIDLHKLANQ